MNADAIQRRAYAIFRSTTALQVELLEISARPEQASAREVDALSKCLFQLTRDTNLLMHSIKTYGKQT